MKKLIKFWNKKFSQVVFEMNFFGKKSLTSKLPNFIYYLFIHLFFCSLCAKVVLNIKWQQLADDDQSKQNFRRTVEATHNQLVHAGFDRFGLLLNIMENPWTDPTITKIMSGDTEEESNSDTEEDENEMSDERKKELEERKKKKIEESESSPNAHEGDSFLFVCVF